MTANSKQLLPSTSSVPPALETSSLRLHRDPRVSPVSLAQVQLSASRFRSLLPAPKNGPLFGNRVIAGVSNSDGIILGASFNRTGIL